MHNEILNRLDGLIERVIASSSRINQAKPAQYWYPLSLATFGTEEILEALDSMCSFRTTMWEKTARFERAFAEWTGAREAVMVNSGSSADLLLSFLLADGAEGRLRPGDTVLVPAVTWPTQIWSLLMAGLRVELVDVDPRTLNISVEDLERRIRPGVRAVSLVHLMGNPCRMDRILALCRTHDLVVLEDCCEALGARWDGVHVGNFGLGGTFSFFFSHHMTTMEGGMVILPETSCADRVRILRAHGWQRNVSDGLAELADADVDPRFAFVNWGFNVRPTELQAGFGLRQLEKLPAFNRRREELAATFFEWVDRSKWFTRPRVEDAASPCWMALPLLVAPDAPFGRRDVTAYLEGAGVETRPIVTGNVARQPAARRFPALTWGELPGADAVHERGFYVGLSPLAAESAVPRLLETLQTFVGSFE